MGTAHIYSFKKVKNIKIVLLIPYLLDNQAIEIFDLSHMYIFLSYFSKQIMKYPITTLDFIKYIFSVTFEK